MLLNNPLLNADALLEKLRQNNFTSNKTDNALPSAIDVLQRKIKEHYYRNKDLSTEQVLNQIQSHAYDDFPRLRYVLQEIFSNNQNIEIPAELQDWTPSISFLQINQNYGYFTTDLDDLYTIIAIACRQMTSIIEQQAYDNEMAYKLMALFYQLNKNRDANFKYIAEKFNKLISKNQDKKIAHPYHDAFVTELHHFPIYQEVINLPSWQKFINDNGFKALSIFQACATQRAAFNNIKEAEAFLLKQTYPRAEANPTLANLCKKLLISNAGFEAGLLEVKTGWPKKETDNLPIVDIADKNGQYFWVKLPVQDMRALYLGNFIPGCCQHIDGHSARCVKDGIRLSDNGFYVILKAKKAHINSPRTINHELNDKDYDIVAQSYAWISHNNNICLDSIEWHQARVTIPIIQDLMSSFSKKIFEEYPAIKYISVGQGGQTPRTIYPTHLLPETMKQGSMYGDSKKQYCIAINLSHHKLNALKERLIPYSKNFQASVHYLAPYLQDIETIFEALLNFKMELPKQITRINLPSSLSLNDFQKISYEDYQKMSPSRQANISTFCKILNSPREENLIQWLPTIPDDELLEIFYKNLDYSLPFQLKLMEHLSLQNRLNVLNDKDKIDSPFIFHAISNPKLLTTILELYPPDQRFKALQEKNKMGQPLIFAALSKPLLLTTILELYPPDQRFEALQVKNKFNQSLMSAATQYAESLKIILSLYPSDNERLEAVKEENNHRSSLLSEALPNPESLKIILSLYPSDKERLEAVKEENNHRSSLLSKALPNPESLKIILSLYPSDNERLEAVKEEEHHGRSLLSQALPEYPESFKTILSLYPFNQLLEAVKEKDQYGHSVLFQALSEDTKKLFIKILELIPDHQRLEAINEKDKDGYSLLFKAAFFETKELFIKILELIPQKQRFEALKEKNNNNESVLFEALIDWMSFKKTLEWIPREQRLQAIYETICDKDEDDLTLICSNFSDHYTSLFTPEVELVFEIRAQELQTNSKEIFDCARSIEQLMKAMEGLSQPQSIEAFVLAIIKNEDIESTRKSLMINNPSSSFFNSNADELIQKSLNQLHPYWFSRIQSTPQESHQLTM